MRKSITYLFVFLFGASTMFAQENLDKRNSLEPITETFSQIKRGNSKGATLLYDIDLDASIIGIDYDPIREGIWLAREGDGVIYLVDKDDGAIMQEIPLADNGIITDAKYEGISVLPNGNILLSDLNGDDNITIENYLIEINPNDSTIVNYWPTEGAMNTSTDGSFITSTVGIAISETGTVIIGSGNYADPIYEISLTPGLPGTWETVATHEKPASVKKAMGIDRYGDYYAISDWGSENISVTDNKFTEIFSFIPTHYSISFNFGVCFIEGTTPLQIAVHTVFGKIGFYVINPCSSITCIENQEVMADETGFYTITGAEFDAEIINTCGMGITNISNDFNSLETLDGALLPIGETTITWSFTDGFGNTQECSFDVTVDIFNGILDLSKTGISIYPNPTSGVFTINNRGLTIDNLSIFDILGKQIIEKTDMQQNETIDLSGFENGIYLVRIQTENRYLIKKIIKH
jgi:hypothetical protein